MPKRSRSAHTSIENLSGYFPAPKAKTRKLRNEDKENVSINYIQLGETDRVLPESLLNDLYKARLGAD
jgi:hypothetical protein